MKPNMMIVGSLLGLLIVSATPASANGFFAAVTGGRNGVTNGVNAVVSGGRAGQSTEYGNQLKVTGFEFPKAGDR